MEVIKTYILISNLRPFIKRGQSIYQLTIRDSPRGTSETSSIIKIPLPWLEFVGLTIHRFD